MQEEMKMFSCIFINNSRKCKSALYGEKVIKTDSKGGKGVTESLFTKQIHVVKILFRR